MSDTDPALRALREAAQNSMLPDVAGLNRQWFYDGLPKRAALAAAEAAPLDVERLAKTVRYHPSLRGKEGDYVDGWDAATSVVLDYLAALRSPDTETAGPEGWRWECPSCDRPVTRMGMCETCGIFGVMRLPDTETAE